LDGVLSGTTVAGGTYGGATVFSGHTFRHETVLDSFGAKGDGANPEAGLINVKGTLYGTTEFGGANGEGTAFSIITSGAL
jgi:uncharacterized repeat protein (TIGR03803 family)